MIHDLGGLLDHIILDFKYFALDLLCWNQNRLPTTCIQIVFNEQYFVPHCIECQLLPSVSRQLILHVN
jgi:hypothetical protein